MSQFKTAWYIVQIILVSVAIPLALICVSATIQYYSGSSDAFYNVRENGVHLLSIAVNGLCFMILGLGVYLDR
jgi:hypothetical protein